MTSEKIGAQHRARKAVLYIRQSSAHQVQHNREPLPAIRDARSAGAARLVGDRDHRRRSGVLGGGRNGPSGFERMVAEVCLGKVGAVAAREVSRFARNSRDWQQLVEMCRVVDTLLIDQETVYPATGQRSPPARAQGQPQRVRTRPAPAALAGGTPREGPARRGSSSRRRSAS